MAGMIGADIAQMRALETTLKQEADTIRTLMARVTAKVAGTTWKGTDAEKFRGEWETVHRANLMKTAEALVAVADVVSKNATAQEATSAA
jgi:uncharacterized protein YukE